MTTSDTFATDADLDDDLGSWQARPSPQHPHLAFLMGGSLLLIVLACMAPVFVVDNVRDGEPRFWLVIAAVVALGCGLGPFLTHRLQNLPYVVAALITMDLLPLALTATLREESPVRPWSALILIPVLIAAATLDRRLYRAELAAGCLIGTTIMVIWAERPGERVLTCIAFIFFMIVCASLARQDRAALDLRFRQWQRLSRVDELTGLLNRRGFVAHFPEVRRECLETGTTIGVVMIDIDHFSRINAERGHAYGDAVLRGLCDVVSDLPEVAEGLVARIGGEELLVVVPRPAESTAIALRAALARAQVHPGLTVSMGICDADPRSCGDTEAMWRLVNLADAAMYRAKQRGRNRFVRAGGAGDDGGAGVVVPAAGSTAADERVSRPVPPRLTPRPAGPVPPFPLPGPVPTDTSDDGDDRLFGAYCLVFAAIGALAHHLAVAVDPGSRWIPVYLVGLVLMAVLGSIAVIRGRPTPPLLTGITCVAIEVCTLSAVLATSDLEYRLMIICVLTVPVLVSAHAMPLPWLGGQLVLVFFGVGLAASVPDDPIAAEWLHLTFSLTAVLCAAPGVLFWLRQRRERANTRLRRLVSIDPLTGVHNRPGLAHGALGGAGDEVRVLAFNVVGFKLLNDTYGHVFGDAVLVQVARTLATAVAATALPAAAGAGFRVPVVGRTGGDRFVVAAPEPIDPALRDRILRNLQAFPAEVVVATGEACGVAGTAAELWALIAAAEAALVRPTPSRRPGSGGVTTGPGR